MNLLTLVAVYFVESPLLRLKHHTMICCVRGVGEAFIPRSLKMSNNFDEFDDCCTVCGTLLDEDTCVGGTLCNDCRLEIDTYFSSYAEWKEERANDRP